MSSSTRPVLAMAEIISPSIISTDYVVDIGTGEIHIVGTMKGGDEFALQKLQVITRPKQIVTYWHPEYGCVGKETLYLNRYDKSDGSFKDVLPNVWINT